MKTRDFAKKQLVEWGVENMLWGDEQDPNFIHRELDGVDGDEVGVWVVFKAPDDQKLYRVFGVIASLSGWCSWENDKEKISGVQVEPHVVTTIAYRVV